MTSRTEQLDAPTPPTNGKQVAGQGQRYGPDINWNWMSFGCGTALGGNMLNPCGFPGWGGFYPGVYQTYRWILDHPTVAHAMSIIVDPIIGASWDLEVRDDAPDGAEDLIKEMLVPQRRQVMEDALWAIPFGWAGFEKVWEIRDGQYWLAESSAIRHEHVTILTQPNGEYMGLQVPLVDSALSVGENGISGLPVNKSWVYTYKKYAGNFYGRSRFENFRTTGYTRWLDAAQRLEQLGQKISGTIIRMVVPPGTYKNSAGVEVSHKADAAAQLAAIANNRNGTTGLIVTAMEVDSKNPDVIAKLIGKSQTCIEPIDFGSHTPAIVGLLEEMKHYENLMFAGMLRSPRTGSDSLHGSRADSEQHTETGDQDSYMIATDIDGQFNRQVVDEVLTLNFGPDAKGAVAVKTLPFNDPKITAARTLINSLTMADGTLAGRFADMIDMGEMAEDADLTVVKSWEATKPKEPTPLPGAPVDPNKKPDPGQKKPTQLARTEPRDRTPEELLLLLNLERNQQAEEEIRGDKRLSDLFDKYWPLILLHRDTEQRAEAIDALNAEVAAVADNVQSRAIANGQKNAGAILAAYPAITPTMNPTAQNAAADAFKAAPDARLKMMELAVADKGNTLANTLEAYWLDPGMSDTEKLRQLQTGQAAQNDARKAYDYKLIGYRRGHIPTKPTTPKLNFLAKYFEDVRTAILEQARRSSVDAEVAAFAKVGIDQLVWITVNGADACPDCRERAGYQGDADFWDRNGRPGSGRTVCGGNCMCMLVPVDAAPEDGELNEGPALPTA